jgi:hypothetical protein
LSDEGRGESRSGSRARRRTADLHVDKAATVSGLQKRGEVRGGEDEVRGGGEKKRWKVARKERGTGKTESDGDSESADQPSEHKRNKPRAGQLSPLDNEQNITVRKHCNCSYVTRTYSPGLRSCYTWPSTSEKTWWRTLK